jgi:hypothetical protein
MGPRIPGIYQFSVGEPEPNIQFLNPNPKSREDTNPNNSRMFDCGLVYALLLHHWRRI